jgi:transcriptional regulator with XRE-family HTH domain
VPQEPEFRAAWDRTTFARDVALRVVAYRTEHGLTRTALADRLGLTESVVARLESGGQAPSIATLAKLTARTGMEFDIRFSGGSVDFIQ